jgi:hypothetical protein
MVLAPFHGAIPVYEDRDLAFWLHPETYEAIRPDGGGESVDLIRLFHEEADKADTLSKCYFIGADTGPVKIGHSINPKLRLRTIQNYSPVKLRIFALASGGQEREAAYHFQFQEHRLHGEWFERCPEIEAEIERLNNDRD